MKSKNLLIILVLAVIIILVSLGIILVPKKSAKPVQPQEAPIEEKIAEELYGFSAEINAIEGKTLILEGNIPLADLSRGVVKKTVRAVVNEATKITKLKFPEKASDTQKTIQPEETSIKFDELKVGDTIHIATIENISPKIKSGEEITLAKIFIIEK